MFKIDLHTHSTASYDGGITPNAYRQVIEKGGLDCVAITDHNRIDMAMELHRELGDHIIIGEEIMSNEGEIIGLYLTKPIQPGLSGEQTMRAIKEQGGLVYVPHPFETMRKGLHPAVLDQLSDWIDLIEVCNGRALLQNRRAQTVVWARLNGVPGAVSSDAHGLRGLGKTYTRVSELPTIDTLVELVRRAVLMVHRPGIRSLLYPKYHRLRRKVRRP